MQTDAPTDRTAVARVDGGSQWAHDRIVTVFVLDYGMSKDRSNITMAALSPSTSRHG